MPPVKPEIFIIFFFCKTYIYTLINNVFPRKKEKRGTISVLQSVDNLGQLHNLCVCVCVCVCMCVCVCVCVCVHVCVSVCY